jgi:hypothetical protein
MTEDISRRRLLRGIGQSAAMGSLATLLPRYLAAAESAAAAPKMNICLSMLYPVGEGLSFDADAFRDRHIGVLKTAYAGGLERVELRVPAPAREGAPPAPLLAAVSMWISDFNKFAAGANAHARDVSASMASITKSAPMAQFDNVIASVGAERGSVLANVACLSNFFEAKDGATLDTKGLAESYVPKFYAAYGPAAIQRIEVAEGIQSANGSKPLMLGAVNFYIADTGKFQEVSGSDAVKQLAPEEAKYYSKPPIQTPMQVHSVG